MHVASPPPPVRPSRHTHKVRIGQKYLLYAILINLAVGVIGAIPKDQNAAVFLSISIVLLALTALTLGLAGVFTIGAGLRYSLPRRIILALVAVVPLVNLVVFLVLNGKATSTLRAAGYKVGLLGAKSSRN